MTLTLAVALTWTAAAIVGYLIGAINPGALVARAFDIDLRRVGSGNPGATNVARALGARWAVLVGFLDILKGFVPALVFGVWAGQTAGEIAGVAAVVGHITSPYLRGRGGKGVATTLGAILGVLPILAIPVLIGFGVGVAISRQVGIGAVVGAVVLLVSGSLGWVAGWMDAADAAFALILGALVLLRHQGNIRRAWQGRPRSTG